MKQKIYIAGAISSLPLHEAKENFLKGVRAVEESGHIALNPFDNGLHDDADYDAHIKADLEMMEKADVIGLLPNWHQSRGAINEVNEALKANKLVILLDVDVKCNDIF